MRLIRPRRQSNEEIFIGMNREGLERHLLKHEDFTIESSKIHHDLEYAYVRGYVLPT